MKKTENHVKRHLSGCLRQTENHVTSRTNKTRTTRREPLTANGGRQSGRDRRWSVSVRG